MAQKAKSLARRRSRRGVTCRNAAFLLFWYAKTRKHGVGVKKVLKKSEISTLLTRLKLYEAGKRKWTASADTDTPDTSMHMHCFWTDEEVLMDDAEDDAGWGFVRYHWRIRT